MNKKDLGFFASTREVLSQVQSISFDYVFSIHRSFRSLYLGSKVQARQKFAFQSFWSKFFGYTLVPYPNYEEGMHYSRKPLELLKPLEVSSSESKPTLYLQLLDTDLSRWSLSSQNYILMSPFSAWGTKTWFADRFARVAMEASRKYNLAVVIIGAGGPREAVVADTIAQKIRESGQKAINLMNQTNLEQMKLLVKNAKLLISNDSAAVHFASAFDIPTVAIFGPTVKKFGFYPLASKSEVVEREDVDCRPCSLHGPQKCPRKHFKCMNLIQVEDVSKAIEKVLS